MVIVFRRFGQLIGLIFNTLTIQVVLTSRSLSDVYIGIVKYYPLCCNKIERLLIKVQTLFPIDINSTLQIISADIITRTFNLINGLFHSGK
jgi:hypothetical protein